MGHTNVNNKKLIELKPAFLVNISKNYAISELTYKKSTVVRDPLRGF